MILVIIYLVSRSLKKISEFDSVDSSKLQWEIVAPNEKGIGLTNEEVYLIH